MLPVTGAVSEPTLSVDCHGGAVTHFPGDGVLAIFVAAAARAREIAQPI
jgi:hypothetical protein